MDWFRSRHPSDRLRERFALGAQFVWSPTRLRSITNTDARSQDISSCAIHAYVSPRSGAAPLLHQRQRDGLAESDIPAYVWLLPIYGRMVGSLLVLWVIRHLRRVRRTDNRKR
jgi:hypothetical protein